MAYIYSRYRPPSIRMQIGELPDHKFGYTKRRDPADPKGAVRYRAECTCRWKDPTDSYLVYRQAHRRFESHIGDVLLQGRLPV